MRVSCLCASMARDGVGAETAFKGSAVYARVHVCTSLSTSEERQSSAHDMCKCSKHCAIL